MVEAQQLAALPHAIGSPWHRSEDAAVAETTLQNLGIEARGQLHLQGLTHEVVKPVVHSI